MNKNLARRAFALLLCALMLIPLFMVTAVADVSSEVKIDSIIADYDEETGELVYTVSASCTGKLAGQSHVYRYTWERCLISETRDSAGNTKDASSWNWTALNNDESEPQLRLELEAAEDYFYRVTVNDNYGCKEATSDALSPAAYYERVKAGEVGEIEPYVPAYGEEEEEWNIENVVLDDPFGEVQVIHATNASRNNGVILNLLPSMYYRRSDAYGFSDNDWVRVNDYALHNLKVGWYCFRTNNEIYKTIQVGYDPNSPANPDFMAQRTLSCETYPNVSVSGLMPKEAWLEVFALPEETALRYCPDEESELIFAYDISVYYYLNGVKTEFQPSEENPLSILIAPSANLSEVDVYHVDGASVPEELEAEVTESGSVLFETGSFSTFLGFGEKLTAAPLAASGPEIVVTDDVKVSVLSMPASAYCGEQAVGSLKIENKSKADITVSSLEIEGEAAAKYLSVSIPAGQVIAAGGIYEGESALTSLPFVEGSYNYNLKLTFKFSGSETEYVARSDEKTLTVSHNFLAASSSVHESGGWCFYDVCDSYDDAFTPAVVWTNEKLTFARDEDIIASTNMLYRASHWYKVIIQSEKGDYIVSPTDEGWNVCTTDGPDEYGVSRLKVIIPYDYLVSRSLKVKTGVNYKLVIQDYGHDGTLHEASFKFRIGSWNNPTTGDDFSLVICAAVMFSSLAAAAGFTALLKKKS